MSTIILRRHMLRKPFHILFVFLVLCENVGVVVDVFGTTRPMFSVGRVVAKFWMAVFL
jgi:hypothetical protein